MRYEIKSLKNSVPRTSLRILLLSVFLLRSTLMAQVLPAARQWLPADAALALEVRRPKALLDVFADDEAIAAVKALPAYNQWASGPQSREFFNLIDFLELTLNTDWRTGIARLAGGGITVAIDPEGTVVAIVDAEDQDMLERTHELFLSIARSEADKEGQPDRVASKEYQGVTAWTFDGKEAHAIIGKRFIICNRPEGLKGVLERRARAGDASLTSNPSYQAAQRTVSGDSVATVFASLEVVRRFPKVAGLLQQQRRNPLAALVFSAIFEVLRDSNWLTAGIQIEDRTLVVKASADGTVVDRAGPAAFTLPQGADEGVLPVVGVPRRIAALSLYRDLHRFYSAKDELFPERTSGLIFFENMMGIFFSGRDLTDEVLAQTKPEIRVVVAEQQYDPAVGTPQIRLPAFAVILRLRHPQEFHEVVEEAWQKAVGLVNFTRGQKALPGLIIDRPIHGGTKYTVAYFSASGIEDRTRLDLRFNFRPTLAMPGEYLILSSSDALARDLMDAFRREGEGALRPAPRVHSLLEVDGDALGSILEANRDTLVRGDMVKKGSTQEEASSSIDMLIAVVKLVDRATLRIAAERDGTGATLKVKLNLPEP